VQRRVADAVEPDVQPATVPTLLSMMMPPLTDSDVVRRFSAWRRIRLPMIWRSSPSPSRVQAGAVLGTVPTPM
jgi:hypothetical protein